MITINDVLAAEVAYTHAGQFHADENTSSAWNTPPCVNTSVISLMSSTDNFVIIITSIILFMYICCYIHICIMTR